MIRTYPCRQCHLCGTRGDILYSDLTDLLFRTEGKWQLRKCTDPECELIWLDPMPELAEIPKLYRDYYTHTANIYPRWFAAVYRGARNTVLNRTLGYDTLSGKNLSRPLGGLFSHIRDVRDRMAGEVMWLEARRRGKLLDVGCGSGRFLALMQSLGWQGYGIDVDPEAVRAAHREYGLNVKQAQWQNMGFPSNYFDAVTMNHVIEHLPEPAETLGQIHQILKKRGRFILTTPNARSWGHRRFGQDWRGLEFPRHLHLYNLQNLRRLLETVGFTVRQVRTIGRGAAYFLTMSRLLGKARHDNRKCNHEILLRKAWRQLSVLAFYQAYESVLLTLNPDSGEEILLIADK